MAESKVQKAARGSRKQKADAGKCACGEEREWAFLNAMGKRARMVKWCPKCGAWEGR